ncbi:MAG: GTPase Era [Deltaproteobacteria bacterium]|nr:GTPase Era [Deltaproteobacteria bacterium]
MAAQHESDFRSGFVAVAGRPNVGKSTLVNRILGQELSIVTPKAQTTRNRITAIHHTPGCQMILIDTPGVHTPNTPLNRTMVNTAVRSLEEADLALMITTPSEKIHDEDLLLMNLLGPAGSPAVLAINKIDTVQPQFLLPVIDVYSKAHSFREIVPISALTGAGVDELVEVLVKMLPVSPPLFPEDDVSDMPVRFFVAEIIREMVTKMTGEEIPYKTAVVVEAFKERPSSVLIQADIHTERDSQKKILIGKGGQMIKKIGTAARHKIEAFLGQPVRLELFVKVSPHWTRDARKLAEFGYLKQ